MGANKVTFSNLLIIGIKPFRWICLKKYEYCAWDDNISMIVDGVGMGLGSGDVVVADMTCNIKNAIQIK
jgi:hypothetical protein